MDATTPLAPLDDVTDRQLKSLYVALWDWKSCAACTATTSCDTVGCPTRRAERLGPFKTFYQSITARYLPEFAASGEIALRGHDDLVEIIRYVKERPDVRRDQLVADYFAGRGRREGRQERPNRHDQERAFNIAIRVLTMVNCSAENQAEAALEEGTLVL